MLRRVVSQEVGVAKGLDLSAVLAVHDSQPSLAQFAHTWLTPEPPQHLDGLGLSLFTT